MDFTTSCCMFDPSPHIKVVWSLTTLPVTRTEHFSWGRSGGHRKEGGTVILADTGLPDRPSVKVKDFSGVTLTVNISHLEDIKIVRHTHLGSYFFSFSLTKLYRVNIIIFLSKMNNKILINTYHTALIFITNLFSI